MIIAGIDPSLTGFAICVGDGAEESVYRLTSKPLGKSVAARMKRLDELVGDANRILEEAQPDAIFIENYSFGSQFNREVMAELGAITRWHLVDFTPHVFEVAPSTLKKFVTGKGKGQKEMMIAHVQKRWNRMFDTNDEVDAFSMYQLGLRCAGIAEPTNETERSSAKTVLKDCDLPRELKLRLS